MLTLMDRNEQTGVRSVLEGMPQRLYRALDYPERTAEFCFSVVQRALRNNNVRAVREWIDYERSAPDADVLFEVLDLAIDSALWTTNDRDLVLLAEKLRRETREYVRNQDRADRTAHTSRDIDPIVDGILMAVHAFDPQLHEHSLSVSKFAQRVAAGMELSDEAAAALDLAARVHEIGKLRLARELYAKPLPYTRTELTTAREQIRAGQAMLRNNAALALIARIVEEAHDLEAGSALQASTEAHILAVTDTFHTLLTSRPYRKAYSPQDAFKLMRDEGNRLDKQLVAQLAAMLGQREQVGRIA